MDSGTAPDWCGQCNKRTRHHDTPSGPKRCAACHPLARRPLPQHRICPRCHSTVNAWDKSDCESHSPIREIITAQPQ